MLKTVTTILSAAFGLLLLCSGALNDDGKAGRTGSPGELDCTACHNNFALNSGGGSIALGATNMTGWEYVPGTIYHMTATVARAGNPLFGMGLEALTTTNSNAGTLAITNSSTQIKSFTVNGVSRKNVVHTLNGGNMANAKTFEFDWTAPNANIGNVTFYYAGVASNADGEESTGDHVYTGSQVVTPALSTSINEIAPSVEINVYPNPVSDMVKVDYALRGAGRVVITLFDLNGRLVEQLLSATRQPGRHTEMIGGLDRFCTGSYLLRTQLGDRTLERRVQIQH